MRLSYFALLIAIVPILFGVSGCDSRWRFGLYKYELTKCPSESFALPMQVQNEGWEIKPEENSYSACSGFNQYFMTDEKWRSGGFGMPKRTGFDAKLLREGLTCSLLLAFSFDVSDHQPEERGKVYADAAAVTLLKETDAKAKIPAKSFELLGGKSEFEKWCK